MSMLKDYWKPTPKKWRKTGDALLAIAMFASPYEIVREDHHLAVLFLIIGIFGKFLTNFFTEDQS